jgi:D-inositol-3-phosphate glycosyltransferase
MNDYCMTIASMPLPLESFKDRYPDQTGIWGAEVAKVGMIRSLLQYAQCDVIYLLCESQRTLNESKDRLARYPNNERVKPILFDEYHRVKHQDRMVLFHPGSSGADGLRNPGLQGLVNLRAFFGRACWPVTGVTHSISGAPGFWFAFGALLQTLRCYDSLVCTSEAGRNAIERLLSITAPSAGPQDSKSVSSTPHLPVIPLGTDTTVYQPRDKSLARTRAGLSHQPVIFLYLGRFSTAFKVDLFPLVLAFSRLPPALRANAKLILAGDDVQQRLSSTLEAFAAEIGISDQVIILANPTSEHKINLYNAADVFLSPSDHVQETFGQTIIEAMASGLPVIASDWDGHRDTVKHGTTGFLVPTFWADCLDHLRRTPFLWKPGGLFTQLSQATSVDMHVLSHYMEQLIRNSSLRKEMGENARRRVLKMYDWQVVVQAYEALWLELLDQASGYPDEIDCDDLSFDYLEVFRRYPTGLITTDSRVRLGEMGVAIVNDPTYFGRFGVTELSGKDEISTRILAACGRGEAVRISELIGRLSDSAPELQHAFRQIAQLIKYGILELCR